MTSLVLDTQAYKDIPESCMGLFVDIIQRGPVVKLDNKTVSELKRNMKASVLEGYDSALTKLHKCGAILLKEGKAYVSKDYVRYPEDLEQNML